MKINIR